MRTINTVVTIEQERIKDLAGNLRGCTGLTIWNNSLSSDVIINLRGVWMASRIHHREFVDELIRTVEHELAHAIGSDDEKAWQDEIFDTMSAMAEDVSRDFETVGAWARK